MDFVPFPKIPRLKRECIITEKIDGTNAQVVITEDGQVLAGSRNRWITSEDDNFGFAKWVKVHEDELREGLGVGQHFGEWWGLGIQRGYGITEKRFSLFNTARWGYQRPACCDVVPVLYQGIFSTDAVDLILNDLRISGSQVSPFMNPEGIVVFLTANRQSYKVLLENDENPKGSAK